MAKKPSRKTLISKLDKLFSQLVRAGGVCEVKWDEWVESLRPEDRERYEEEREMLEEE